jgi:hypothetical protein
MAITDFLPPGLGPAVTIARTGFAAIEWIIHHGTLDRIRQAGGCSDYRVCPTSASFSSNPTQSYLSSLGRGVMFMFEGVWVYHPQTDLDVNIYAAGLYVRRWNAATGRAEFIPNLPLFPCRLHSPNSSSTRVTPAQ